MHLAPWDEPSGITFFVVRRALDKVSGPPPHQFSCQQFSEKRRSLKPIVTFKYQQQEGARISFPKWDYMDYGNLERLYISQMKIEASAISGIKFYSTISGDGVSAYRVTFERIGVISA